MSIINPQDETFRHEKQKISVDSLHFKLNTLVLSDQLPEHADVVYLFAEPNGVLREMQIRRALELKSRVALIALCGGTGQGYEGFEDWAEELKQRGVDEDRLIALSYEEGRLNTYTESMHLVKNAKEKKWERIFIVAPVHQQLRACMTVIGQLKSQKVEAAIYNAPGVSFPWHEEIVHYQGVVKDVAHVFIDAEVERVYKYQASGDLPCFEEVLAYLAQRDAAG